MVQLSFDFKLLPWTECTLLYYYECASYLILVAGCCIFVSPDKVALTLRGWKRLALRFSRKFQEIPPDDGMRLPRPMKSQIFATLFYGYFPRQIHSAIFLKPRVLLQYSTRSVTVLRPKSER